MRQTNVVVVVREEVVERDGAHGGHTKLGPQQGTGVAIEREEEVEQGDCHHYCTRVPHPPLAPPSLDHL